MNLFELQAMCDLGLEYPSVVDDLLAEARATQLIDDLKLCASLDEYLAKAKEIVELGYDVEPRPME